jgi:hypothetical protein
VRSPLDQIPSAGGGLDSDGAVIFSMHRRGEITTDEYYTRNAELTAALLHQYNPWTIQPMDNATSSYVFGRINGQQEHDERSGVRLGEWVYAIVRATHNNAADMEHLLWCKERLLRFRPAGAASSIDRTLAKYAAVVVPATDVKNALRVQRMDSIARDHKIRGSRR